MKALLDTNVVIDFFRNPQHKEAFEARTLRPQFLMSSVVAMELFAGCRTPRQHTELTSFLKAFQKAGRVVTPDHADLVECGRVLAKLGEQGVSMPQRRRLVSDVMIAVSAEREGAIIVTANARNFALIGRHTPVRWMLPGG